MARGRMQLHRFKAGPIFIIILGGYMLLFHQLTMRIVLRLVSVCTSVM